MFVLLYIYKAIITFCFRKQKPNNICIIVIKNLGFDSIQSSHQINQNVVCQSSLQINQNAVFNKPTNLFTQGHYQDDNHPPQIKKVFNNYYL